ncbi:MAG: sulfite exporter TauE/SafE family protein [Acidobacteria bacterium]|nr:sulfite exporter TauE/SafE family protein [Acidobacteriota bacterium]
MDFFPKAALLILAGAIAGIMNALAGGGTLLTFPSLVLAGLPTISANATSTVALLIGVGSSIFGYRRELSTQKEWAIRFAIPSLLGGIVGAVLLLNTEESHFRAVVPFLILFAATLFTFQKQILRLLEIETHALEHSRHAMAVAMLFQVGVAIYGGYFGAGIGILMLASLGVLMGAQNVLEINSVKVTQAFLINITAAVIFIASGKVYWVEAAMIAIGAGCGGMAGPWIGRRVGPKVVRWFVSVLGFGVGIIMLLR